MNIDTADFLRTAMAAAQFPRDGMPEIAFVGRSNVGKSSLMNRLLNRKGLARTSSTPGRTRAVNYFVVNRRLYFVDLPGYGYAKASKADRRRWAALMEDYLDHARDLALFIQLVDSRVGATALDQQAYEFFVHGLERTPLVVATKIDKVPRSKRHRQLRAVREALALDDPDLPLAVSAQNGEGVKHLWNRIER
ncbi:MAG: ribosome biogenesis GTP-binding protein YihA/YsxC, partial [Acidobacteriota bacterium]